MELARCPDYGSAVGGRNHLTASGVTPARDLERAFGRMEIDP